MFQKKAIKQIEEKVEIPTPIKKGEESYVELIEVPTQTTVAFKEGDEVFEEKTMLKKIYDKLCVIEKNIT